MAYFNHAFKKTFVVSRTGPSEGVNMVGGLIVQNGLSTTILSDKTSEAGVPGVLGIFNPKTYLSLSPQQLEEGDCCPILIAGSSLKDADMQGMHGGYLESNKSKVINPKYVSKLYKQAAKKGNAAVMIIGGNAQEGGECTKEFICGETYYLRLDIKGTAALRFAHHNIYHTIDATGGCCEDPSKPESADPVSIYGQWANAIANSPYLKDFVVPALIGEYDGTSYAWYANAEQAALMGASATTETIDQLLAGESNIVGPNLADISAPGILLTGAYEDTMFGDCTFQPSDFYAKAPLQLFASETDLNGDPCAFNGVCIEDTCKGVQNEGLGEAVLRDLITSEAYLQNFLATDLRIREITQGTGMVNIIDRKRLYNKLYLLHSVPRFNNPTGVFDNDQYMLEFVFPSSSTLTTADDGSEIGEKGTQAFELMHNVLKGWLTNCNNTICLSEEEEEEPEEACVLPNVQPADPKGGKGGREEGPK